MHIQKTKKLIISYLFFLVTSTVFAQPGTDSLTRLISRLGQNFLQEKKAVGLTIGIYDNGKSSFYNFGTIDTGKSIEPTQNTVYEIGSITKTFVSYVLSNAVIEEKLNLDDDIRMYLKDSYPNLEFKGHPIKLVHLANTTSMLPDWLPELPSEMKSLSADSALKIKIQYYKNLSKQDFFNALHTVKLDTIPGTKRYHSNGGAQLLAYILEGVYQKPMDKLIKQLITQPQKMKRTSFISSSKTKGLAAGYTSSGTKAVYEFVMPYFKNAGGMASCAADLVKYIELMLNRENKISVLCLKKTIDVNASTGQIVSLAPEGTAAPDRYSAALNWFKYQPDNTSSQVWTDGGTNGFNSYLVLYPQQNSGIILLTNKSDEKIFKALPGIAYQISTAINQK